MGKPDGGQHSGCFFDQQPADNGVGDCVHFIQRIAVYANVRLWPKADIRTESKSVVLNVCFGEKSGRSAF